MPRKAKVTTISDILTRDDVNGILDELVKNKANISDMVVLYLDGDNKIRWMVTNGTLNATAVWMLESIKMDILNADIEGV